VRSQRRVKWAKFRVACVSAVALAILAVILWLLTGGAIFQEHTHIFVRIPDATGLDIGSLVRVDGIVIGKVDGIALSGSQDPAQIVRLSLKIQRDALAMMPTGSYADLGTEDPAGDKFVDITSRGGGVLTPNSEIPYRGPSDVFKTLDFAQFETSLRQMDAILTQIETGQGLVGQFVQGNQMYNDVRRRLADIENAIRSAEGATATVGKEVYSDRLYRKVQAPVLALDQALARLQSGQGAAGQLLRDSAQYDQTAAAIRGLRDSIAGIRAGSWIQSDALYTDLSRWVFSMTANIDNVNAGPLFAAPQTYESWNGMLRDLEKTMRDFRGNPRKYLRLKVF
jgi:phospholipid/cholesterol/gamma-HCH transport system substrate-binding protein